jgi:phage tail-like protein
MSVPRVDPVGAYNFLVTFLDSSSSLGTALSGLDQLAVGGFSEVGGLEGTLELEEYKEGGRNDTVRKFPTRMGWSNLRLKRGVAAGNDLWDWHRSFVVGLGKRRDGLVVLRNDLHEAVRVWVWRRGLPMKWMGPQLEATQSRLAVEELEIAHEGLEVPTIPGGPVSGLLAAGRQLLGF